MFDRKRQKIGVTRFELVTSCSQGRRANQAALHPATSVVYSHRKRTQASRSRAGQVRPVSGRRPICSREKRIVRALWTRCSQRVESASRRRRVEAVSPTAVKGQRRRALELRVPVLHSMVPR